MDIELAKALHMIREAIRDAQRELDTPEVAELTSMALDRKLAAAITRIEGLLNE